MSAEDGGPAGEKPGKIDDGADGYDFMELKRLPPEMWSSLFSKRCRARLSQEESPAGKDRFGRCELKPHGRDIAHSLEYGMYNLRWRTITSASD